MALQDGLNVVTLIMCIVTMTMATAALMPQIKQGLVILRDGLLWAILLGIIGFVGFVGWGRLHEARQRRLENNEPSRGLISEPLAASDSQSTPDLVVNNSFRANQGWQEERP